MSESSGRETSRDTLSRRSFLKGAGGVAAAGGLLSGESEAKPAVQESEPGTETQRGEVEIELDVNGAERRVRVEPRTTLLSALRTRLSPALTGTKEGCNEGTCGACTVMVDGQPAYACLLLAVDLVGRKIRTIEGLGTPENLSPVQEAFCEHDGLQCGYCTPGFVVATTACLEQNPDANDEEVRRALSGNLCRCGSHPNVFTAAQAAGARMRGEKR